VSRIHDLGGLEGLGAVAVTEADPPFHADWEARVFALMTALLREGVFTLDEMRDAIERLPPDEYLAASYYERWFKAICTLLVEKGVATPEQLAVPDA
jgi:nitrile hydratase subunit beta